MQSATELSISDLDKALEKVKELLRADGGDIVVSQVNGTEVQLRLILENSSCPECVLPADVLEPIALQMMSAEIPGLTSVSIADPR